METGRIELSKRKCTLYRRQRYPFFHRQTHQRMENIHDIFCISSFSFSSNSSSNNNYYSPDALAYKRCMETIWSQNCAVFDPMYYFHYTLEVIAMQSVYDNFPASSYTPYQWDTTFNDIVLTKDHLSEQQSPRRLLLTQAAQRDCRAPCYVAQFRIGRNKKHSTFHWLCAR